MKHYKFLKPYIRRVNGKEIYDGDVRVAYKLAVYQKYKIGYVLVARGFPNEAILIGKSKEEIKEKFILNTGLRKFKIKSFKMAVKYSQIMSKLLNIEVNHEDRPV